MRTLPAALLLAALSACAPGGRPAAVAVSDAWCRPTLGQSTTGACYVTLKASGADQLLAVETPAATDAQIHSMSMEGGVMRMAPLPEGLPLPAGESVQLQPGGDHLMLVGLVRPLSVGDRAALTLKFRNAPPVTVQASVRTPGEPSHPH
ncbi:MAG: copper chaperone PCu(A)C [Caulobacteraceae bacterium]|nr:copper chaperone PCu(A)C [Caulobacteraceae bacterium]